MEFSSGSPLHIFSSCRLMPSQVSLGGFLEVHHYVNVWKMKSGLKKSLVSKEIEYITSFFSKSKCSTLNRAAEVLQLYLHQRQKTKNKTIFYPAWKIQSSNEQNSLFKFCNQTSKYLQKLLHVNQKTLGSKKY